MHSFGLKKLSISQNVLNITEHYLIQDGAEHGSRVASSEKTLQFFVNFISYFVVLRVGCC